MTKLYKQCERCKKEFEANKNSLDICPKCEKDLRTCDECGCGCISCSCTTYGGCESCGCGR